VGEIRIIGGSRRGRRLTVPPLRAVRPTGDRVREAVFDVLGPLEREWAIDVFAGSGALGLEALSRGATRCVFVERDPRVCAALRLNIARLGFGEATEVVNANFLTGLRVVGARAERYDVLFLDPPYRTAGRVMAQVTPWLRLLLRDGGLAVVEGPKGTTMEAELEKVFERNYGDTCISMFRKVGS